MNEWIIVTVTVLYAITGTGIVADVWLNFKVSTGIRKFFRSRTRD